MQMLISRRALRDGLVAIIVVGSMALGAAGCAGGDDDAPKEGGEFVAGTFLCGGQAVSDQAGKALEVITGSSRFEESDETSTVVHAARELSEKFTSSATGDGDICTVFAEDAKQSDRLEVTWELTGGPPEGEPASKFRVLRMGERALAAPDAGVVQFACRNEKSLGSQPAHVDIGVERWSPEEPEGDPEKLTDAYATVAHSVSLAMAKELGCENNGGLEPRPVLAPA
ncbi:hypothetical protein K7395_23065 [Streptomyces filamentosus]|uniref:Lipoprotein n=2 Tax=Streptomyces filamentosus TaxID=67294 RepID=A0ABY4UYS4_STRFL|nr:MULTISPECIES: hypothetical protein [Streptomyces]EFE74911.1 predicted protein [Streptomyces filamentosus NRRL 15998]ESU47635.1 hypothetical protein P376_4384 [Streptomyces sp. HCCB10043]EWS91987.1 hypothetical protein SSIG_02466 [Streptomyces filamentosus NRRL 11379]MYR79008.1 hypothetical protein [Streptomyces sp. SID5466]USC49395.1 hypothetical protein K7395_23065 [Streptomyces filamentosus]